MTIAYGDMALPTPIALHLHNLQYRRVTEPVWHDERRGTWHIYRYSDVARVLADTANFGAAPFFATYSPARSLFSESPRMALPIAAQRHAAVRNVIKEALTPRAVLQMQPSIARTAGELLSPLLSAGKLEAVSEFARPLATSVVAELVGLPVEEKERVQLGSAYFARLASTACSDSGFAAASVSAIPLHHRSPVPVLDQEPHEEPGSRRSLISRLLSVEIDGERLTDDEVAASCYFFMTAARRALSDTLGNMLLLLSLQPDLLKRLDREPAPFYSTVEEALRYLPPVWTAHRTVAAPLPVSLGGQSLPQGAHVCAWLISANHDPEQFAYPDHFDVDRIPNRHLSFGGGTFSCLASGLARLAARLTLAAIARRISTFELAPGDAVEVERREEPGEPGEPGEARDARHQTEPGEQTPPCSRLPERFSLTKLDVLLEGRD